MLPGYLRFMAVFGLIACLLSVFAGCSMMPLDDHTVTTAQSDATTEATTLSAPTPAETPANLNGYIWSLRTPWSNKLLAGSDESESAQRLRDIYTELKAIYNIEIIVSSFEGIEAYLAAFAAGSKYADVIGIKGYEIPALVAQNAIYSVEDPAILSAGLNCNDRSRFWPNASSLVRYADKQWTVQIASRYDVPAVGHFVLCNGSLLKQLGAGNLYNLLQTGKWTIEQYQRLASAAASLTKLENVYGTGITSYRSAYHALGGQYVSAANGRWKSDLSAESSVAAAERFSALVSPDNHALIGSTAKLRTAFAEDQLLFLWVSAKSLLSDSTLLSLPDVQLMPVPSIGQHRVTPLTDYTGYAFPSQNATLANSVAVFNALALRLNEDWSTQLANLLKLDAQETAVVTTYCLPSLQFFADEYDRRLTAFFDETISAPLVARTDRPEAILKGAEPALVGLLKELPAPTATGR